jgi:P2-related tail formation protein
MERAVSQITNFPTSAVGIRSFADQIKKEIMSGSEDVLKAKVMLKAMRDVVDKLEKDETLREMFQAEACKYAEKSFSAYGMMITKTLRTEYDFSKDTTWNDLQAELSEVKERIKSRETFLKAIRSPLADPETGEMIYPPTTKQTESISLKPL